MFSQILLILLVISTSAMTVVNAALGGRPIFGILLETTYIKDKDCPLDSGYRYKTDANYKSFIEQSGGSAVLICTNQPTSYYDNLLTRLNGVLLPGGGVNLITSPFGKTAYYIYKKAMEMNDRGIHFPIIGICMGFQEMTTWPMTPRTNYLVKSYNTQAVSLPVRFTKDTDKSNLLKTMPEPLRKVLTLENITPNFHHWAFKASTFSSNRALSEFYYITSTSTDQNGMVFVASIEAKKYPFYGFQWHPEKINYYSHPNREKIDHSWTAMLVSQYISNYLIYEGKRNNQTFVSYNELSRFLANNFPVVFSRTTFTEYYYLKDSDVPQFDDNNDIEGF